MYVGEGVWGIFTQVRVWNSVSSRKETRGQCLVQLFPCSMYARTINTSWSIQCRKCVERHYSLHLHATVGQSQMYQKTLLSYNEVPVAPFTLKARHTVAVMHLYSLWRKDTERWPVVRMVLRQKP